MMAHFALGAIMALLFPTAAVHTQRGKATTPEQHIPAGLLVFENKQFLAKCALTTDPGQVEASQEGLPLLPLSKEMATQRLAHNARRYVNFTGTWVMKKTSGDMLPILRAMGVNHVGVKILGTLHFGVGHLEAHITHKGNLFTIHSKVIGSPYEEVVSYRIGMTQNNPYKDTICAEWTNTTKNEFVVFTKNAEHSVPALYRYMEGNQMVTKGTLGKFAVYEYWNRVPSRPSVVALDPEITQAVEKLSQIGSFADEVAVEKQ